MPTSNSRRLTRLCLPRWSKPAVLAGIAFALVSGCGPFGYLTKVSKDANKSVADAKAAGAEEYAPYEYWGAVAYLEQAKVLMAYSEYERSFDYGVRAKQLAEEAKRKADMRETGSTRETLEQDDPNAAPADPNAADSNAEPAGDASATGDAEAGNAGRSINVGGGVGGGK